MTTETKIKSEYSVDEIANYFIEKGIEENKPSNPMKLQKILYFAYGWYLAYFGDKKLFDEAIQAWKYGPVIESVYHEVKSYGNYAITSPISKFFLGETSVFSFQYKTPKISFKNDDDKDFLDSIWKAYSKFPALQLSAMTHEDGTPWHALALKHGHDIPKGETITDESIKEYFSALKNKNKK